MKLFFGLSIVLIGVLLLGGNLEWWTYEVVTRIFWFWPVILVALGIRLIIKSEILFTFLILLLMAMVVWLIFADIINIPGDFYRYDYYNITSNFTDNVKELYN